MAKKGSTPGTFKDILGQRFTRLVVIERAGSDKNGNAKWECQCDCGNTTLSSGFTLRNGEAKSCGCLTTDQLKARTPTHRMTGTPEYMAWASMLQRCYNQNATRYERYGGRGIKVCERWLTFEHFYADMGSRPTQGHSLERKNNDADYGSDNCCWATSAQQNANKANNHYVVYKGRKMTLQEAAETAGIVNRNTVQGRLKRGWPLELALEAPPRTLPRIDAGQSLKKPRAKPVAYRTRCRRLKPTRVEPLP